MKGFTSILSKAGRPQLKTNKTHESNAPRSTFSFTPSFFALQEMLAACSACNHTSTSTISAWLLTQCSVLTSPCRCQVDKLATGRTAALHCLPSSIFWRHWYFSFLPDSFSLAFHTKSQFSFPNSSGKVLVDSYRSQKSLTTAHDPNDEAIQPGWGPCFMTHSSQMSRWQSLIHMILKFT